MNQIGTFTPDNLIAGDFPRATGEITIPSGDLTLKRGTIVTRAGVAMETGGTPFAVLAEDADPSDGAVQAPVYFSGQFARRHLILEGNASISDNDWDNLRALQIYVVDTVPAA